MTQPVSMSVTIGGEPEYSGEWQRFREDPVAFAEKLAGRLLSDDEKWAVKRLSMMENALLIESAVPKIYQDTPLSDIIGKLVPEPKEKEWTYAAPRPQNRQTSFKTIARQSARSRGRRKR